MKLPNAPQIPLELDDRVKEYLDSLEVRLDSVDSVKVEGDVVHVLGRKNKYRYEIEADLITGREFENSFKDVRTISTGLCRMFTLGLYSLLIPSVRYRKKQTTAYVRNMEDFIESNLSYMNVYQGGLLEAEKAIGKELEFINTGQNSTFLRRKGYESGYKRLIIDSYNLGAIAIIHYTMQRCGDYYHHIGTPVRFADKEKNANSPRLVIGSKAQGA